MTEYKSKLHRVRSILLNLVFFGAFFLAALAFQSRNMLSADGDPAPGLRGVTLSGEAYDLDKVGEKPALVYFFAPWCRICAASAGNLNRLQRWRDDNAIEIVAVALDWQTLDEVRQYAERHELKVTVVLGAPDVGRQWRIQAFPSYYVLDSDRRIVRRDVGYSTQLGLWLRAWLI